MGWRDGVANLMDYVGQYAGSQDLMKEKQKLQAKSNEQEEITRLMRGPREFNLWTNPNDPVRKLLEAKYPGMALMKGVTPQQWMKLKNPGYGGGFNFGGGGSGAGGGGGIPEI